MYVYMCMCMCMYVRKLCLAYEYVYVYVYVRAYDVFGVYVCVRMYKAPVYRTGRISLTFMSIIPYACLPYVYIHVCMSACMYVCMYVNGKYDIVTIHLINLRMSCVRSLHACISKGRHPKMNHS